MILTEVFSIRLTVHLAVEADGWIDIGTLHVSKVLCLPQIMNTISENSNVSMMTQKLLWTPEVTYELDLVVEVIVMYNRWRISCSQVHLLSLFKLIIVAGGITQVASSPVMIVDTLGWITLWPLLALAKRSLLTLQRPLTNIGTNARDRRITNARMAGLRRDEEMVEGSAARGSSLRKEKLLRWLSTKNIG